MFYFSNYVQLENYYRLQEFPGRWISPFLFLYLSDVPEYILWLTEYSYSSDVQLRTF